MSESMYITCPHISKDILTYALERIIELENSSSSYACLSCSYISTSLSGLKIHHTNTQHAVFVRIGHRPDLYCTACGDFQYCSYFDNIIGKKRKILVLDESGTSLVPPTNPSPQPPVMKATPGLVNMGSTCFMNSVLQVLSHCREFVGSNQYQHHAAQCARSRIKVDSDGADGNPTVPTNEGELSSNGPCIPCEFRNVAQVLSGVQPGGDVAIIPSNLLYAVWNFVDYMAGYTQQDAHEFLIAFLNSIDCQLRRDSEYALPDEFSKLFTGQVQSQLLCTVCGNSSTTNEGFTNLSLTVDRYEDGGVALDAEGKVAPKVTGASTGDSQEPLHLLDSIALFTSTEMLAEKVRCDKCNVEQFRTKTLRIAEMPELLIFHFKRFDFFRQKKLAHRVEFPLRDLSLEKFAVPGSQTSGNGNEYQLIGLVSHFGTLHQGHYISYIFDRKLNAWMKCDDETVTIVDEVEVAKAEAYLLFYQKMEYLQS